MHMKYHLRLTKAILTSTSPCALINRHALAKGVVMLDKYLMVAASLACA